MAGVASLEYGWMSYMDDLDWLYFTYRGHLDRVNPQLVSKILQLIELVLSRHCQADTLV